MHETVLEFIKEFQEEHGYAPTYREIRDGCHLSSTSQVAPYIDDLIAEGKLSKTPGAARTLRVLEV